MNLFYVLIYLNFILLLPLFEQLENNRNLTVQVLVCTDYSIYRLHESILSNKFGTGFDLMSDYDKIPQDIVIDHIKNYYSVLLKQVNVIIFSP
jgi:hypothetical protein